MADFFPKAALQWRNRARITSILMRQSSNAMRRRPIASRSAIRTFREKSSDLIRQGVNLLIVDVFPPSPRDPQGIHKAIWDEFTDEPFELPADKPLTLVAYQASPEITAYVEPVAVGDALPDMPLFLDDDFYVNLPLEATYAATWNVLPKELKALLA
jgi:hypothetical protein